jgi:apolipoprotein N-acyltransferase
MLAAALLAAAFPPVPLPLLAGVGMVPILWGLELKFFGARGPGQTRKATFRRLFASVYLPLFLWNQITCYWLLYTAAGVGDDDMFVKALVAAEAAHLANAALMALPFVAYGLLRRRLRLGWALAGWVAAWIVFEYAHQRWDLTWPWLMLGNGFASWPGYVQWYEWTGVLGGTALLLGLNAWAFGLYRRWRMARLPSRGVLRQHAWALVVLLAVPAVLYFPLTYSGRAMLRPVGTLGVRIIQPNVDPYEKFNVLSDEEQVDRLLRMIDQRPLDSIQLVILPETSLPGYVEADRLELEAITQPLLRHARQHGYALLVGHVAYRIIPQGQQPPASARRAGDGSFYYESLNAANVLNGPSNRTYVKGKLVPMTERVPFVSIFGGGGLLELDLGGGFGSFGMPLERFALPVNDSVAVATMICYESAYGQHSAELLAQSTLTGRPTATLSAVITNDGWFGNSSGYIQHAQWSRLRAIEQRRAIPRCANTGQSHFTDVLGRVSQPTPWWQEAIIDDQVPLYAGLTLYARWGDWLMGLAGPGLLLLVMIAALPLRYRRSFALPPKPEIRASQ